jgi:hypothetical protein
MMVPHPFESNLSLAHADCGKALARRPIEHRPVCRDLGQIRLLTLVAQPYEATRDLLDRGQSQKRFAPEPLDAKGAVVLQLAGRKGDDIRFGSAAHCAACLALETIMARRRPEGAVVKRGAGVNLELTENLIPIDDRKRS